jgi:ankyrin repeat protein
MDELAFVRWIVNLRQADIVTHGIAIAVALFIYVSIVFLVMWLALPHLLHGPDALVWLVTGIFVVIALPMVWFIHNMTSRIDKAFLGGNDVHRTTKIHELAHSGDLANLKLELHSSRSLERRDEQGYTPLMVAITSPQAGVDVVRCLIEHGADVNAVSAPPRPLAKEVAAMKQAGLDTSFLDRANQTPAGISALALAVERASLAEVELLVKSGADVTWIDDKGYSVLLKALFSGVDTVDDQRWAILEYLVAAGAPLDCVSDYGESVLTVAARVPDVELVKFFLDRGADPSVLRWSEVFRTIAFGTPEDLSVLLRDNPSLEDVDCWERTPFLFAVHCGKLEMAKRLLEQGCNRSATGRVGSTAVAYAIEGNQPQVLQWLLANGWDFRQPVDQFTASALRHAVQYDRPECVRRLIEAGAEIYEEDEYGFDLMHEATSPEVTWILHQAGLDLDGLPSEQRARLLPANDGQPFEVTAADYQAFHAPRFGQSNPDEMGNPFWNEMVRIRCSAYTGSEEFGDGPREWPDGQKVWCFSRHGHSLTRLPSGQLVEIGGEHEDFYDPDFCIYNDVVVHDGQGRFRILGYPREVFPPTDFHSATFVDGDIYIIGSLGYPGDRRSGETPVFRLNCETWNIQAVPSGGQTPGWIHGHRARVEAGGTILIWGGKIWDGNELVDNQQAFRFDTRTGQWNIAAAS